ncbi:acetyltransferase [Flavobacterium sp. SUN052]|uniref:acetyltransferase n=1 Tax=Flavobacterium sp. SUN052 TaxID=3002441 RepID=UPI00237DDBAB|nr:acetyltransferase [Flavobacterium sp. SUN052]MEC4004433.1 acetyltransferase [Flavobacterium sp. SUN052]
MLIVGAKGFAKEVLEVLYQNNQLEDVVFYDDVNVDVPNFLYDKFKVLTSLEQAEEYFEKGDKKFTIGIGNPILRKKLSDKFLKIGGIFASTISPKAAIGNFGNSIDAGCNIMTGCVITNDIEIKEGVLVNLNCTIGHDCIIGNYVEMSPGVHISGNCKIEDYSVLGTNATVLPGISIGKNVIVGAGSVVTKDLPDNCVAVGIPAKIIKELAPLEF